VREPIGCVVPLVVYVIPLARLVLVPVVTLVILPSPSRPEPSLAP